MSDAIDTSAEACRGGVALLRAAMTPLLHSERLRLGSLIEALLAERDAAQVERDTARRNERIARGWKHQAQAQAAEEICARNEAENKLEAAQAEVARLREALEEIERGHIPSMPMTEVVDELTWVQMWVGNLRKIARLALAKEAPHD